MLEPPIPIFRRRRTLPRPGPASAPAGALVTAATIDGSGQVVTLLFDQDLSLVGPGPWGPLDGSLLFDGLMPIAVEQFADPRELIFTIDGVIAPGAPWQVAAQPLWIATALVVPQSGMLAAA